VDSERDERTLGSNGFFSCAFNPNSGVAGAEALNLAAIARSRTFPIPIEDSAIEARLLGDLTSVLAILDGSADEIAGWFLSRLFGLINPELDDSSLVENS
jgi:hypothetical protein